MCIRDRTNWDELLIHAEVAYNSAPHATTTFSPFFLNYGREVTTVPFDSLIKTNTRVPAVNEWLSTLDNAKESAKSSIIKTNESQARYAKTSLYFSSWDPSLPQYQESHS